MRNNTWSEALVELLKAATAAFVRFWKQDMLQVGLTVGMFLALALPLLLVVLLLWYLDHTGWRASPGFYTIGLSQESCLPEAKLITIRLAQFDPGAALSHTS